MVLLVSLFLACGGDDALPPPPDDPHTDTDTDTDTDTSIPPTWSEDVWPLFVTECQACHTQWGAADDPDATWEVLTTTVLQDYALVAAGASDESAFYLKVTDDPPWGGQMPAQQDYLTDQEREPLTTWIADGAAEDDVFRAVVMADLYYDRRCYRCHGDWEQGDGLHAFLIDGEVSGERYVVPGDPDSSLLLQKLEEAPPWGERMPLQFELLSHAQQERIRQWISDGAANN